MFASLRLWIACILLVVVSCQVESPMDSWPNGPVKAIYVDDNINWDDISVTIQDVVDSGYNLIILAFYLESGPGDVVQAWDQSSDDIKMKAVNYAHSKGAKIIASYGGSTEQPYDPNMQTAVDAGNKFAAWISANHLDGGDFDLENLNTGFTWNSMSDQQIVNWIVTITNTLRNNSASFLITHAPQGPYFGAINGNEWTGPTGGYTGIYQQCPSIDYFFVQFYNQGGSCYTTYEGLFNNSNSDCSDFPGTSLMEIAAYGIPAEKLVVGKFVQPDDASDGWMTPDQLKSAFAQAQSQYGWNVGLMGWEWHSKDVNQAYISGVYSS